MSRARPRALQHLKEEDEVFWDTPPATRRPPPLLDLKEAQDFNDKPLALPRVVDKSKLWAPTRPGRSNG